MITVVKLDWVYIPIIYTTCLLYHSKSLNDEQKQDIVLFFDADFDGQSG